MKKWKIENDIMQELASSIICRFPLFPKEINLRRDKNAEKFKPFLHCFAYGVYDKLGRAHSDVV